MRDYPRPALGHLLTLTDDVGVLQHAVLDVPNRACGYCTDDAGRALIVACDAALREDTAADGARLVTTYLAYLHDAQLPDGWFHNFMGYDRRWQDDAGTEDAVGRAIWGLGYAERFAPRETWRAVAGGMRRSALGAVRKMTFVRSRAYAALGLAHALAANAGDALVTHRADTNRAPDAHAARSADARRSHRTDESARPLDDVLTRSTDVLTARLSGALAARSADELELRAVLDESLARIADAFDAHAGPDWQWCEDVLTYDNARLCEALLRGGAALGNERYVRTGLAMLSFYTSVVIENDPASGEPVFVPVGNDGWYPRGGTKARYGQQPLEAAAMVDAALAALDATGDERWCAVAEVAHGWYLGRNAQHVAVATESGCRDGIDERGVNANMGAESTICYLMSATAMANRSASALRFAL
jgi:hypothetical protein